MRLTLSFVVVLVIAGCGGNDWDNGWQTTDGDEVDEVVVSTGTGCPDEDTVVLHLRWPVRTPQPKGPARQYVRDPSGRLVTGGGAFDPTAKVPDSARFSGYRRGDVELWIGDDADEYVYLVFDDHVERWPRVADDLQIGCG